MSTSLAIKSLVVVPLQEIISRKRSSSSSNRSLSWCKVLDEILSSVEVGGFSSGAASDDSKEVFVTVLEVLAGTPVGGCVSSAAGWFPRDQLDGIPGNDGNRLPTNKLTSVNEESW